MELFDARSLGGQAGEAERRAIKAEASARKAALDAAVEVARAEREAERETCCAESYSFVLYFLVTTQPSFPSQTLIY